MLTKEQNERLTSVGPGTPGGELMRRYWLPIAPFAELLENPVKKVRILGEDLTLYKDKSGHLGLIGDRCLHRNVDMKFGIPDECGLRCPYHGWLYNETGKCVERPMEGVHKPRSNRSSRVIRCANLAAWYSPIWAGFRPRTCRRWDLLVWPNAIRQIGINIIDCNWLQCQRTPAIQRIAPGRMVTCSNMCWKRRGNSRIAVPTICIRCINANAWASGSRKSTPIKPSTDQKGIRYSKALGADSDKDQEHSTVIFPFYTQTGKTARRAANIRSACL